MPHKKVIGGGGGSVTLCQLMNICDSLPLGGSADQIIVTVLHEQISYRELVDIGFKTSG
jgi:hypothetical protein